MEHSWWQMGPEWRSVMLTPSGHGVPSGEPQAPPGFWILSSRVAFCLSANKLLCSLTLWDFAWVSGQSLGGSDIWASSSRAKNCRGDPREECRCAEPLCRPVLSLTAQHVGLLFLDLCLVSGCRQLHLFSLSDRSVP